MVFHESRPIGHVRHVVVKGMLDVAFHQNDSPALMVEDVDASDLLAANGGLRISGAGNIAAAVQSDVYSDISGIEDIAVYGNPLGRRQERVTGMRRVRYM